MPWLAVVCFAVDRSGADEVSPVGSDVLQRIVTANINTLNALRNIGLNYSSRGAVTFDAHLRISGERILAEFQYLNEERTQSLLAFDGSTYQWLWRDELRFGTDAKQFRSAFESLWVGFPGTMLYSFLPPDESFAGGIDGLADPEAWADLLPRIKSISRVAGDQSTRVRLEIDSDFGRKVVYFDEDADYFPVRLEVYDHAGRLRGEIDVIDLYQNPPTGASIPSTTVGRTYDKAGRPGPESIEKTDTGSIEVLAADELPDEGFRLPTTGARVIRDLDLGISLKENEAFEVRSPLE